MKKVVTTFGEIMLRLSPSEVGERLSQATQFRCETGGSESNVAIALSNLGLKSRFITKLPDNELSSKVIRELKQFDVDTSFIQKSGNKIGVYWTENGVGPRNSFVVYDRENSSFSETRIGDFNWTQIFNDSLWFHFSGISPAVSESVKDVLMDAVNKVRIPYSVDLNYRKKLWNWISKDRHAISGVMTSLCSKATMISGNESDFQDVLNIAPDLKSSEESYPAIADRCFKKFPNLQYLSISNRRAVSASRNIWNGYLFVNGRGANSYISEAYDIENIKDRVGTGDSFVAGIIYGLINRDKMSFQGILDFATTLAALNHTTLGDASTFSEEDVLTVMGHKGTGRIIR